MPERERESLWRVHWYSEERLHRYLVHVPPVEFEAEFYAQLVVPSTDGAANVEAA